MSRTTKLLALCASAALLGGCMGADETDEITQNEVLHRMQRQAKYKAYQRNDFYPDLRSDRLPPQGTLSREAFLNSQMGNGYEADGFTFRSQIPMPVDMALLELGKKNFEVVCAACHGLAGDGQSMVAMNMALMPPPSFHSEKLRTKPDGYIYTVAGEGYGAMPPFAWRLTPKERWAVVAYIRALQFSQSVPLAEAPADVRAKLMQEGQ